MENDKNKKDTYSTEKGNENYPGYPHYPANEDITRAKNNTGKEEFDEKNASVPNTEDQPGEDHITPYSKQEETTSSVPNEDDETNIIMGTEANVTADELKDLEEADQNMDTRDDRNLLEASLEDEDQEGTRLAEDSLDDDMTGEDLDIPGAELDDADEAIGEEDEENNYYSLGGDNHENLDEDNYNS